jgi:SAM-dependent methyltransferase
VRREDWDRRYAESGLLWSAAPNRFLVAELAGLTQGRALDLACGEGRNALWLAAQGWRVTGVDFSEVAIAKARERAERENASIDFVRADLVAYEPEREAYDLVLVFYLHIVAALMRIVLGKATAALAPGGTFLLVGHDLSNPSKGVGGPTDPAVLYTPGDVAAELPGLVVEKAERVERDVEGEERPAIDALVRARKAASPERAASPPGGA